MRVEKFQIEPVVDIEIMYSKSYIFIQKENSIKLLEEMMALAEIERS